MHWGFYDTGNANHYKLPKSYETAVSFVLSNTGFPPLSTVSKLHSNSINAFPIKHVSNTTNLTPFSKNVLPISKGIKLRTNPFADCYVTHYVSLNLFQLKCTLLIMFYVNLSSHVILSSHPTSWCSKC